jgi:hypothetical protein
MSKYANLRNYLRESTEDRTTLSFAEIEKIVGAPLPESARLHREWWAHGGHSHQCLPTGIAMALFPGGAFLSPASPGYSFFHGRLTPCHKGLLIRPPVEGW